MSPDQMNSGKAVAPEERELDVAVLAKAARSRALTQAAFESDPHRALMWVTVARDVSTFIPDAPEPEQPS